MNPFYLVAALADLTAVVVHGVIGHRIIMTPLGHERLFATRAFGGADMSRRILLVSWHLVTAAFACSSVMMFVLASGIVTSVPGALFLSAMHVSFLLIALLVVGRRVGLLLRPIPSAFVTCMTTVAVMGWLGS